MPETIPTELPVYGATNNCSEPPEPLTICEWATAPDAIVFAKVVDTRGFENPAEQNGGVTSTCPRAEPGFALDIRVLETIHGSAPPELTIRIGQEPLSTWEDIPRLDRDDLENPTWGSSATARVLPGMVYGLALYDVGESWTPATEPWFARTASNGLTVMDGTRELCRAAPDWLDGMSVADLKAEIANCSGTEGKARRDRVMTAAQAYPDQVYAADCYE